jgi:hypothetical protein
MLVASMKGPNGEKLNRNAYSTGGEFIFTSVNAEDIFESEGTYTITLFTEYQQPINGTVIKIEYDNGIASMLPNYELILKEIGNKQVDETEKLSFTVSVTDSSIEGLEFSLEKNPSGATIDKNTGKFTWTPTNTQSGGYIFDIIVKADTFEDRETISVTVVDKPNVQPEPKEIVCPQGFEPVNGKCPDKPIVENDQLGIASFVDKTKDPQSYVDRYNNESRYKEWFDTNFAEYDSIYQAVGLKEKLIIPAPFVDKTKDPQSYVDRYNNEASYKKWFDENHSKYSSIYEAVGLEEPKVLAPFVDPNLDPQHYIDRYTNEASYKKWFDETYPEITIYGAVGLDEPEIKEPEFGQCGEGTRLIADVCEIFDEIEYGLCGEGTELVGKVCEVVGKKVNEKPWWQFW